MCGITGLWSREPRDRVDILRERVLAMSDALAHRGPDDGGIWVDASAGLALGHRRLSILDLSKAGAQPMISSCGRYVLAYNGEVYNFRDLASELEARGQRFRGHSDTEVVLEAIATWGVRETVQRLNGMFAFALWDTQERQLTLARDRAGKKPLYWGRCGATLLFGSELKALRAHPAFDAGIDGDALALLLRYAWIPAPRSIYRGIGKLEPGTLVCIDASGEARSEVYWSARELAERAEGGFNGSPQEAEDILDALLHDAVGRRTVADVPVGALLSGGIDSSVVVGVMQDLGASPVRTYTIGFEEERYDEADHARAIAAHLGTQHTELRVTPRDALDLVPVLPHLYDEPLADASQIPTHLVCRLARSDVTVALSGDGGDELFAGYKWHHRALRQWERYRLVPRPLRRVAAATAGPGARAGRALGLQTTALEKLSGRLDARDARDLFGRLHFQCEAPEAFVRGARRIRGVFDDPDLQADTREVLPALQQMDFVGYLADDVLQKVDRASMGVSLEVRCPLLDPRIVELAWSLPVSLRSLPGSGEGKHILKQVLGRYVPRELWDRPKRGFGVPVADWLRGPLREWADDLLAPERLRSSGLLHENRVRGVWQEHSEGRRNHGDLLWSLLMFESWRAATGAG